MWGLSVARQHLQQMDRARQMAVKDRTARCNQIHGLLLEYRVESPRCVDVLLRRLHEVLEDAASELPGEGRILLRNLSGELKRLPERALAFEARLAAVARDVPACQRLMAIPGIGVLTVTALVAIDTRSRARTRGQFLVSLDNGNGPAPGLGELPVPGPSSWACTRRA